MLAWPCGTHSPDQRLLVDEASYTGYLCDRGPISRRLKSASFVLTVRPLYQAGPVGGLCRASPVPFRASCLTTGIIPGSFRPNDTPTAWTASGATGLRPSLIPPPRLVAHRGDRFVQSKAGGHDRLNSSL